jgi:epoxyqueuosine reductase QueG
MRYLNSEIKKTIKTFTAKHGCIIGVCDASPLLDTPYAGFTPFVYKDIKKRTNPGETFAQAQSIIVIGCGYEEDMGSIDEPLSLGGHKAKSMKNGLARAENSERSNAFSATDKTDSELFCCKVLCELSSLGQNTDYHKQIKKRLRELVDELKKVQDFRYKILVDSPGLDERAFAVRAGLGFYGRMGLVVSREFGSRFHIGLLLTDIEIETDGCFQREFTVDETGKHDQREFTQDETATGVCPVHCDLCIKACPTGALNTSGVFIPDCCISYLTQKDSLSPEEEKMIGNQLYGCDICQDVCPFNAPRKKTYINPNDWLNMDDEDFQQKYGHTAMLWRGADILRRNARIKRNQMNG